MRAAEQAASPSPQTTVPAQKSQKSGPQKFGHGIEADLSHLAALHREAAETAHLANLLGRAPYAAGFLIAASGLCATFAAGAAPAAQTTAWLILMMIGAGALTRAYGQAIRAPFERAPLSAFSQDCEAILTYAGFAWGAGAFLALPADTDPLIAIAFGIAVPALVAWTMRGSRAGLFFLLPATVLSAIAMAMRPLPDGGLAAAATLAAAASLGAALYWAERENTLPQAAKLPFGTRTAS